MYDFDTQADFIVSDATNLMPTYARLPVQFVSGKAATLTDSKGRKYLDFLAGIGVCSLGHAHPKLVKTLKEQAEKLWQVGNYFYVENRSELAAAISDLLNVTTDTKGHITGKTSSHFKTFFANSGAEANEGAIKLARLWGEKKLNGAATIISAKKSFHGRTLATLAATGQDKFHEKFCPMPQGFAYTNLNDTDDLLRVLDTLEKSRHRACAVLLECIQGEGGVWPADNKYLQFVQKTCREQGLLLLIDEVQTGFFRTGAPFAYQRADIEPDIVSLAKGIASGFPMGAFAARDEIADLFSPGDHGTTFGGNPLAAAVGRTTLDTLIEEHIGDHVIATGDHFAKVLLSLKHVKEVRGAGLMRGVEFDMPIASTLVEEGLKAGLVLNHIGDSILRFLPPLVITTAEIDEMVSRLNAIITRIV